MSAWPAASLVAGHVALPDVVYITRDGRNAELRYSLRSLENLPHGTVHVVGGTPGWLSPAVNYLPRAQDALTKGENGRLNRELAFATSAIAEEFLLFNDDFFILEPLDRIQVWHRGPVAEVLTDYDLRHPGSYYTVSMRRTLELLRSLGIREPLSYELHAPLPMHRSIAANVSHFIAPHWAAGHLHWRTLYGNLARIGGEYLPDVKTLDFQSDATGPIVSTSDQTFLHGAVGAQIRARFTAPSLYEVPRKGMIVAKYTIRLRRPLNKVLTGIRFVKGRAAVETLLPLQRLYLRNIGATVTEIEDDTIELGEVEATDVVDAAPVDDTELAEDDATNEPESAEPLADDVEDAPAEAAAAPSLEWSRDALTDHAKAHGIDLHGARTKPEILAAITAAQV